MNKNLFITRKYLFILMIVSASLVACNDDEVEVSGKIKTVYTYNEDHVLRKTESYEYDEEGKLIKESVVIDNTSKFSRTFSYNNDGILVSMNDNDVVVNFTYDTEGQLVNIAGHVEFSLIYEEGQVKLVADEFTFNYDNRQNLRFILNSDQTQWYMAKGAYEYDDKKYAYNSLPVPLRLYFAVCRSEGVTLTTNTFRFNPGPNNIKTQYILDELGAIVAYRLFDYQYQGQGFPINLKLQYYTVDANGVNTREDADHFTFEYY